MGSGAHVEVRGQPKRMSSLFQLRGSWGLDSNGQTGQQALLASHFIISLYFVL